MQAQAGEKLTFYRSNNFMRSWSVQVGKICDQGIELSTNRAPPAMRDNPSVAPAEKKTRDVPFRRQANKDPYANVLGGAVKAAGAVSDALIDFRQWLKTPPPEPKPLRQEPAKTVPPFDIQEIPGAMRKVSMPLSADLMDKWFAGQLNYSPTSKDETKGINQHGMPYPPSMVDTTSVKIDWVLKFRRARKGLDELIARLETPAARGVISRKLVQYRNRRDIWPWLECRGDIALFHKNFQFQVAAVEGSLSQKLTQFVTQSLFNEGVPDDLTGALGSFNLYAAISYAYFDHKRKSATVTHVSVYVRDNFTFTDDKGAASQYLGHWNRSHVAIVPAHEVAALANIGWMDYSVVQGDVHAKDAVVYPVKNSDFRAWQLKHNQGGDFIIYTDRLNVKLAAPITVTL